MPENKEHQSLVDLITPDTKVADFAERVEEILTPDEKQRLGDNAADKVVTALSYLGVYAEQPADFSKPAFTFTCGLDENEADVAWDFLKRTMVLKEEESAFGEERASISKELKQMLADPANGFLT